MASKSHRPDVVLGYQAQRYLMMFGEHDCPAGGSPTVVKNGRTYYGKDRLKCTSCQRQVVKKRTDEPLSPEGKRHVALMLAERISREAIPAGNRCRVMEIRQHQFVLWTNPKRWRMIGPARPLKRLEYRSLNSMVKRMSYGGL